MSRQIVLDFLKQNKLCVLSTLSAQHTPQSALVAFAEDQDLNLYFQTRNSSRKYRNLQSNQIVSVVIGWELDELKTLQYEGVAAPVETAKLAAVKQLFLQKDSPSTSAHLNHKDARLFVIKPTWIRYSDYSTGPPTIWQHNY